MLRKKAVKSPREKKPKNQSLTGGRPLNIVLHGPPGVGKTDFAANFPNAGFIIDPKEVGIHDLVDYKRCPTPKFIKVAKSFSKLRSITDDICADPQGCETVVYDSATGFELQCFKHHCKENFDNDWTKEGFYAFQSGPKNAAKTDWNDLLDDISKLNDAGLSTILIAHTQVKPYQNPSGKDYDRFTPYLDKETWAQTHRWAQTILFYNYSVETEQKGKGKAKAKDEDARFIFTTWTPAFDAKNRFGLPSCIDAGDSGGEAFENFREALVACRK